LDASVYTVIEEKPIGAHSSNWIMRCRAFGPVNRAFYSIISPSIDIEGVKSRNQQLYLKAITI